MPEAEIEECLQRLLEVLGFFRTEFLRVYSEHGFHHEGLTTALSGLAVPVIDSLSAALLALHHYDLSTAGVMVRRFEEHFALMVYFTLCDNGEMLSRWFKNPKMVLTERNHKIRKAVDAKIATFFKRNPDWSFKDTFRAASAEDVHATWQSVRNSICWAASRYVLMNPEARNSSSMADTLRRARAIMVLGVMGPSAGRFVEFLEKTVFERPEFAEVSPGTDYLASLDDDLVRWWRAAGEMLDESECQGHEASEPTSAEACEHNAQDAKACDPQARPNEDDTPPFESEIHRLDWLIGEVEEHLTNRDVPPQAEQSPDVFMVTSLWLNSAVTQAKAILLLITQGLPEAVGPLQRALWERWTEWRYLLRHGDRALNAAKVNLNAMLEALDTVGAQPGKLEPSMLAQMERTVQEFEAQHPRASTEIRAQRKKHMFHWSGMSRSKMEQTLGGDAFVYQYLSWDAHGAMGSIRDISIELNEEVAKFRFGRQEDESDLNRHAWMSGGVLFYIYNDFAELWGLPPVVVPHA